uniref:Uncharacterized protein n=1 Tax=Nelumbo nucifera TaxID=4432 RepID=A0A822Y7D7_NELNU|nr:TPA_asm: hypothetical protein HUJ06_029620 [Nelumbo nucifera]
MTNHTCIAECNMQSTLSGTYTAQCTT